MPTKKRRKNILGTMTDGDSVLLLPLFVSLVDIIKMPQTGQRKCLKLANENASNWPIASQARRLRAKLKTAILLLKSRPFGGRLFVATVIRMCASVFRMYFSS
jgi:hypothetical protein